MIRAEKIPGKDGKLWIKASFRYSKEIVEAISKVKGAIYIKPHKSWGVPYEYKQDFVDKVGDFLIQWEDESEMTANGGISEDTISDQPIVPGYSVEYGEDDSIIGHKGFKTRPWGMFQVKGFNTLVSRNFLILADEAGLGKSWQIATSIEAKKKLGQLKRGIVIVKASLIYNWRDEIEMHSNEKAVVAVGTAQQRAKLYNDLMYLDDWTFLIISYETYRQDVGGLQMLDNRTPLDFCVVDEAHKLKNPKSRIGDVIHRLPFRFRYILTGTPLPNSPLESYNYLKFGGKTSMNYFQFEHRYGIKGGYGDKEIVGYQNMNELKTLIQLNMLRRRKKDKLKELPEVTFKTITLDMTKEQKRHYKAIKEEIMEDLRDTTLESVPGALAKLLRLQQVTNSTELIGAERSVHNSSKLLAIDELLEDLIDEGEQKVLIFSRFRTMVNIIQDRYKKYNPSVIHGDIDANGKTEKSAIKFLKSEYGVDAWNKLTSDEQQKLIKDFTTSDRQQEVYKFQNDSSCKLFIGCTPACREGLTLTAGSHVIFLDCEWSPAYVEQAYSRAHRIGQRSNVNVYYLVCQDTIDEHVQATLKRKESMAQMMIDDGIQKVGASRARYMIASMIGEEIDAKKDH